MCAHKTPINAKTTISSPRTRKEHKNKKINNMLLLFEKRRGTACGGGDEKTQVKKVKLPTPCGYSLFITKKRESLNCPSAPTAYPSPILQTNIKKGYTHPV